MDKDILSGCGLNILALHTRRDFHQCWQLLSYPAYLTPGSTEKEDFNAHLIHVIVKTLVLQTINVKTAMNDVSLWYVGRRREEPNVGRRMHLLL